MPKIVTEICFHKFDIKTVRHVQEWKKSTLNGDDDDEDDDDYSFKSPIILLL